MFDLGQKKIFKKKIKIKQWKDQDKGKDMKGLFYCRDSALRKAYQSL